MFWLIIAASFGQPTPGQDRQTCLTEMATTLEASGEQASDVAWAAVRACKKAEQSAHPGSLYAQMPLEERVRIDKVFDEMSYKDALLVVVRLRACRKTSGCNVSTLND